jgi:hypothetical protein
MHQAGELEFDVLPDSFPVEAAEERGRRSAIEATIVVENPDSHAWSYAPMQSVAACSNMQPFRILSSRGKKRIEPIPSTLYLGAKVTFV